ALALALEVEHSGQLAVGEQRNGRSALNALETRQLDLDRGRLAAASTDALLHGRVQRTAARKVRDADDPTPLRGNPDQADADWHLGSYTRRDVPVARDCEQPVAALVGGEQNRIGDPEQIIERLQPDARRVREVDTEREAAHELVEKRECVR